MPKKVQRKNFEEKKNQNLITIYTTVPNSNQFGDEQIWCQIQQKQMNGNIFEKTSIEVIINLQSVQFFD